MFVFIFMHCASLHFREFINGCVISKVFNHCIWVYEPIAQWYTHTHTHTYMLMEH